jgi:hypothetical protein
MGRAYQTHLAAGKRGQNPAVVHVDATSIAGLVGMDSVQVMPSGVSLRMSQAEKDTAVGSCQVRRLLVSGGRLGLVCVA